MYDKVQISIVIPTKNEERNILRCLTSVKKLSRNYNTEIIVVDNYSGDKTRSLAKKFTDKIFLKGPERSSQKNFGAKKASGDWLLFVDADMEVSRDVILECMDIVKKSLNPPMIAVKEEAKGKTFWGKSLALEKKTYRNSLNWVLASRFYPRKTFLHLGGFDNTLVAGEDWDLTQRALKSGVPMFLTQKAYVVHHEEILKLSDMLKKELYYLKNIRIYAKKQPQAFSYQQSILYRSLIWIRSWKMLIKDPLHTFGFILYKLIVWIMWQYVKMK